MCEPLPAPPQPGSEGAWAIQTAPVWLQEVQSSFLLRACGCGSTESFAHAGFCSRPSPLLQQGNSNLLLEVWGWNLSLCQWHRGAGMQQSTQIGEQSSRVVGSSACPRGPWARMWLVPSCTLATRHLGDYKLGDKSAPGRCFMSSPQLHSAVTELRMSLLGQ